MTKRSAQNSPHAAPPEETFFIDRSLGSKVVSAKLTEAGWKVIRHDDIFPGPEVVADVEWIKRAGAEKWVILTSDDRIRYNPAERQAMFDSGTHAFILAGAGDKKADAMASAFISARTGIKRALAKTRK